MEFLLNVFLSEAGAMFIFSFWRANEVSEPYRQSLYSLKYFLNNGRGDYSNETL